MPKYRTSIIILVVLLIIVAGAILWVSHQNVVKQNQSNQSPHLTSAQIQAMLSEQDPNQAHLSSGQITKFNSPKASSTPGLPGTPTLTKEQQQSIYNPK